MAGGYGAGDPPDPIPNSEVKTRCADGTAGATRWESTAPPAYLQKRPLRSLVIGAGVSRSCRFLRIGTRRCEGAKHANPIPNVRGRSFRKRDGVASFAPSLLRVMIFQGCPESPRA